MNERMTFKDSPKGLLDGMLVTEMFIKKSGFDLRLAELIKYRVSQINGCLYCLVLHHKDSVSLGETEVRLHSLAAWKEAQYFNDKEKAALLYAEVLTNSSQEDVSDEVFENLTHHFTKSEIAVLTIVVTQINVWNRINKAFRRSPEVSLSPSLV
ncbi:alkylhydroperoxidase AhpD family core domain-containing protein [Reichenbachiella faecimaris]|uniref:Alkylhydroperoxidase AhpD family core domain-containing protein n=1 Tax=Reichenbachiella faecimaris TaxID=692418 RepID=A0A1W2GN69_REIFA|nr:carboxymuconolactone decarboxylase family protein [Reichenbachiella faecimaris]SMD37706.1 alkylhydroperoxidase AhpD family core domain-containing protein [Reichenbachiella faecimaris]